MNAVVTSTTPLGYADIERLAASIAQSGLFGIKTKDQAIALMMIAHAEGRHPALAARDYDVIQGRPAKKAEAMLRDFLEASGKVQWHALSDEIADATFSHPAGGSVRVSWDMERAAKAGLGGKDNWKKFPRQMLRSRTVSEGVRTVWPMATSGMHVPEETVDFTGTTLDAEPEAPPLRAAAAATPRAPRATERTATDPLDEPDGGKWLRNLDMMLANAQTRDEVIEIGGHRTVGKATAEAPEAIKRRISELLAKAYGRFTDDDTEEQPEDERADEPVV